MQKSKCMYVIHELYELSTLLDWGKMRAMTHASNLCYHDTSAPRSEGYVLFHFTID